MFRKKKPSYIIINFIVDPVADDVVVENPIFCHPKKNVYKLGTFIVVVVVITLGCLLFLFAVVVI
jgi:hypothetical protein